MSELIWIAEKERQDVAILLPQSQKALDLPVGKQPLDMLSNLLTHR